MNLLHDSTAAHSAPHAALHCSGRFSGGVSRVYYSFLTGLTLYQTKPRSGQTLPQTYSNVVHTYMYTMTTYH